MIKFEEIKKNLLDMDKASKLLMVVLAISFFTHFFDLGKATLQGDEASGVLAAIKTLYGVYSPKFFGSIFLFGHAPLRSLTNIPFLVLGVPTEFLLRLPYALFGALCVLPIFYITELLIKNRLLSLIPAVLYAVSGIALNNRLAMGVGVFQFFHVLSLYYLMKSLDDDSFLPKFLICLFLAAITYVEAVIFSFGVFALLIIERELFFSLLLKYKKHVVIYIILFLVFLGFWFSTPYVAFKKGVLDSYATEGAFRVFNRVSANKTINIFENITLLAKYNPFYISTTVFITYFVSIFYSLYIREKKNLIFLAWSLCPVFYFTFLVANPTNHIAFYYCYLVIPIGIFIKIISSKIMRLIFVVFILCSSIHSLFFTYELTNKYVLDWGPQRPVGFHEVGVFLRENSKPTDKILAQKNGFSVRYYTGLSYTENLADNPEFLISSTVDKLRVPSHYKEVLKVICSRDVYIYSRLKDIKREVKKCGQSRDKFFKDFSLKIALRSFYYSKVKPRFLN